MSIQIRSLLLFIVFLSISKITLAQKTADPKFLFKTWLFLEHNNTKSRDANQFPIKDFSLFSLLQNGIDLKFDTLKMRGFSNDYAFFSATFAGKNPLINNRSITYKQTQLAEYIDIPVDNCEAYILCVNNSKGTSYRLKGFYGNDFLSLFHEVQANYLEDRNKRLSIKQFLKGYSAEGLDFECLFEGLTSAESDFNKFPCLKKCSDITITVH